VLSRLTPKQLTPKQAECLQSALRCREKSERAQNPFDRAEYLEMAERWEKLARSYGLSAQLQDFIANVRSRPG
jgi:hypothetical protein